MNLLRLCIFLLLSFPHFRGLADDGWTLDIRKRESERKQEKWYFSEYLAGKAASNRQDMMYRFFLGKRTPKPRVELVAYGLGELTRVSSSTDDWVAPTPELGNCYGYGGRVAFNNFLTWLTGLPTLNIVPNAFAEFSETKVEGQHKLFLRQNFGVGFRLFGQNPEDTSVYIDYARKRIQFPIPDSGPSVPDSDGLSKLTPGLFEGFVLEIVGQLYLFPVLGLKAGGVLNQSFIETHQHSDTYLMQQIQAGGHLDLAMLRLGYEYSERLFTPRNMGYGLAITKQITHAIQFGFVF